MCGVEGDLQQLALGADRFEGGFAGLLELALQPWCDSFDQFFGRADIADQCGRDADSECDFFNSIGALEAYRQDDCIFRPFERPGARDRVDAAGCVQQRLSGAGGTGALL